MIGKKFGNLTVLEKSEKVKNDVITYKCLCDCGNITYVRGYHLCSGHTKSCGCLHRKHGKTNTRLYVTWDNMKARCYRKHNAYYKNYGGRGIAVCEEWKNDFKAFYEWSIANGYTDKLTLDRIDNNGNYEPSNCRWIDMKQQARNRRSNKIYTINGKTHCLAEWCEIYNMSYDKVKQRLNKLNWSIDKALEI